MLLNIMISKGPKTLDCLVKGKTGASIKINMQTAIFYDIFSYNLKLRPKLLFTKVHNKAKHRFYVFSAMERSTVKS